MAQEIDLGGTIYISSKRAAEISGYAQDYIGQLCRAGHIEAKRISGLWYILEASLRAHEDKASQYEPTPPVRKGAMPSLEESISVDGEDYISAPRAAQITGYTADYVGQLARAGKVRARQVGKRWYISRDALMAHKEEKDSLLAAVQVEAVGIQRREIEVPAPLPTMEEPHFHYESSAAHDLLPVLKPREASTVSAAQILVEQSPAVEAKSSVQQIEEPEVAIPIRILGAERSLAEPDAVYEEPVQTGHAPKRSLKSMYIASASLAIASIVVILAFSGWNISSQRAYVAGSAAVSEVVTQSDLMQNVEKFFSKEIRYRRR